MSGNKNFRTSALLKNIFPIDPTAKYDTFPEPGIALDELEPINDTPMDTYYYISDERGNMKWIFPSTSRFPLFLTFHNVHSLKGRFYKFFVNLAFLLKLKKLVVSGSIKLAHSKFQHLAEALREIDYDDFVLSSEEVERRGKSVFAIGKRGKVTHFVKVAHTPEAEDEIENEMYALEILGQTLLKNFLHDSIAQFMTPNVLVLDNCIPKRARRSNKLQTAHIKFLTELYERYLHEFTINDLSTYREINDDLIDLEAQLSQIDCAPAVWELLLTIKENMNKIPPYYPIPVSLAHNDFTPWNIYKKSGKLHVTSWATARESMPILHDLFHFIYQTGALQNWKQEKVNKEIEHALDTNSLKEFVQKHRIDIGLHQKMYLAYAGALELKNYVKNKAYSLDIQKRQQFWLEAIRGVFL